MAAAGFQQTSTERDRALRAEADLTDALSLADRALQDALVAQAEVALDVGARGEAELLAAEALALGEHAGARGVLAAFAQRERPRVLHREPLDDLDCRAMTTTTTGDQLFCAEETRLVALRLRPRREELWSRPMEMVNLAVDDEHGVLWAYELEPPRVWRLDASTGQVLGEPVGVQQSAWALRPGPNGEVVHLDTSTSRGHTVYADGRVLALDDCSGEQELVARSTLPDGRELVACTPGVWVGGRQVHEGEVFCAGPSPDGSVLAVCARDEVLLLELDGTLVERLPQPDVGMVRNLVWSPSGDSIVVITERGGVRLLWPGRPGSERLPTARFPALRWEDERTLVSLEDELTVWRVPEPAPRVLPSEHGVTSVSFSPDGTLLVTAYGNGDLRVHAVEDGRLIVQKRWQDRVLKSIAFSRDGTELFATAVGAPRIMAFDVATWEGRVRHPTTCRRIAELFDGSMLCTAYSPQLVRWPLEGERVIEMGSVFWDLGSHPDGTVLAVGEVGAVLFTEDGMRSVSEETWKAGDAGADGELWVLAGLDRVEVHGSVEHSVELPEAYLVDVALSPDGRWLAAGNLDGILMLWRVEDMQLMAKAQGHGGQIAAVDFSHDGCLLATGSWDGDVRIWSLEDLDQDVGELRGQVDAAWGLELDEVLERRPR